MGPILEMVVTENILECLVQWHLRRGLDPDSQGALLKLFEMLIGQSQQPLLQHTAVLHPLLRLLGACADPELGCPSALENSLVLLLNQVHSPHPGNSRRTLWRKFTLKEFSLADFTFKRQPLNLVEMVAWY